MNDQTMRPEEEAAMAVAVCFGLTSFEYERTRVATAKKLKVRPSFLDNKLESIRGWITYQWGSGPTSWQQTAVFKAGDTIKGPDGRTHFVAKALVDEKGTIHLATVCADNALSVVFLIAGNGHGQAAVKKLPVG